MSPPHAVAWPRALACVARLTAQRLSRSRAPWIAVALATLPLIYAALSVDHSPEILEKVFKIEDLLLVVVPPLLVAGSIGEELEAKTASYLWSRPLARWTVIAGKLCALAPLAIATMLASWVGAIAIARGQLPPAATAGALAIGTLAIALIAAGIATLAPRQGMALAIVYVLVDFTIGNMPLSLPAISVTHHIKVVAHLADDAPGWSTLVGFVVIPMIWLWLGLRRVGRMEI